MTNFPVHCAYMSCHRGRLLIAGRDCGLEHFPLDLTDNTPNDVCLIQAAVEGLLDQCLLNDQELQHYMQISRPDTVVVTWPDGPECRGVVEKAEDQGHKISSDGYDGQAMYEETDSVSTSSQDYSCTKVTKT